MLRVTVPGFALLSVLAPELTLVALGPRWAHIAPLLAILACAMPLQLVLAVSNQALNAIDRPGIAAAGTALLAASIGAGAFIGAPFGLIAITSAVAASYLTTALLALGIAGRYTGFGPLGFVTILWRPLLAALVMAGILLVVRGLLPETMPDWQVLAVLLPAAAPAYLGPLLLVDRRGVRETIRFLRS
jgi:PST family polysaccharide transporter